MEVVEDKAGLLAGGAKDALFLKRVDLDCAVEAGSVRSRDAFRLRVWPGFRSEKGSDFTEIVGAGATFSVFTSLSGCWAIFEGCLRRDIVWGVRIS